MTKSAEDTLRDEWDLLKKSGLLTSISYSVGNKKIRKKII